MRRLPYIKETTDEISETTKEPNCPEICHQDNSELFGINCRKCGIVPTFADDATILVSGQTRNEIQIKLDNKFENISNFLSSNKLTVNKGKTTITECMTRQKRVRQIEDKPSLQTTDEKGQDKTISQTKDNRILGANIHENLSWKSHLQTGEKAVIPTVRKQLGALKHLSKSVPKKGRLLLANGLLVSKIIYLMPVWGGC